MKTSFTALLILLTATISGAAPVDKLILITEEYPPLNYTEDDLHRGIATDLLVEMLARTGSLKSHKDIASLPWARGYELALDRENVLLFSMTRTDARDELFQWVGPILPAEIVLLARKDAQIKLDNLQQLEEQQLNIGVVLADVGHQILKAQHVSKRRIYPSNQGVYLARMLAEKRVDLIAYDALVSRWNLRQLGFNPDDYETVYSLKKADYYYAFNQKTDAKIVARLQKEFDRLRQIGRVETITKEYLK